MKVAEIDGFAKKKDQELLAALDARIAEGEKAGAEAAGKTTRR